MWIVGVQINGPKGTQQTITDDSGTFHFENLQPGRYFIVAAQGTDEVRQSIGVDNIGSEVVLQLSNSATNKSQSPGRVNSVSVQALRVPQKAQNNYKKAVEAINKHDLTKAGDYANKALSDYHCYADALTLQAVVDLQTHSFNDAVKHAQKAVQCDVNQGQAYFVMGSAYNNLGRPQDALRVLNEGVRFQPDAWQPYFEIGSALIAMERYGDAVPQLRKSESLAKSEFAPIHSRLATALLKLHDYQAAVSELQMYLKEYPANPDVAKVRDLLAQLQAQLQAQNGTSAQQQGGGSSARTSVPQ